ncbi:MAG: ATP-binding protein [Gemmatimonadales bacterium]
MRAVLAGFLSAIAALSVGIASTPRAAAAQAQSVDQTPKRILILYDENKDDFPGLSRTDRSLRDEFRAGLGGKVEIYSESMGLSRSKRAGYDSLLADFYRNKYAGVKPDLIIAVMEPALNFLLRHGGQIFPDVPIVFASIDASIIQGKKLPANITGVLVKRTYSPTLEAALRLQPDTRQVFVVGGGPSPFDQLLQTLIRRDLGPFEHRVQITYLFDMTMDALLTRVSGLPPHSVVLYLSMLTDASGRRFVPAEALQTILGSANAPVYVYLEEYVGLGAVGGNVWTFRTHAAQVAALGLEILRGASPASLPLRELGAQINLFDARQLKRWHLNAARLPLGSVIRNQDSSVWALYRWYIIGAVALLLTQGTLIGGLLLARARQRRAEAEARRQRDDLAHVLRVTTLGEMTSSLVHEISHPVAALLLNARAVSRLVAGGQPKDVEAVTEVLADITADAQHASLVIDRLRALFRRERVEHSTVDVTTLIKDAVRLLRAAMLGEGIDFRQELRENLPAVSGDPVQLEQVLLNVLINACDAIGATANGARVITIRALQRGANTAVIEVRDTGIGLKDITLEHIFDHFVSTKPKGLGMGLAISRSIIEAHGGRIWATANTDRGLTVHIELPCLREHRSAAKASVEMG